MSQTKVIGITVFIYMDHASGPDLLSDLPLSIVESILQLLPIRDAVKTSILSRRWRYRWASVPQLVFDDKCVNSSVDKAELFRCELDPPPTFRGFLCLKSLNLQQVFIAPDAIESLIFNSPLLESLTLSYFDTLELSISAPNLKDLYLEGEFKEICLENTPLLSVMSIALYMTDDIAEHFDQCLSCNFAKFLGGAPNLRG
ncbi:hypothetical protein Ancab_020972 [Ancistrocladus abbreviatus]